MPEKTEFTSPFIDYVVNTLGSTYDQMRGQFLTTLAWQDAAPDQLEVAQKIAEERKHNNNERLKQNLDIVTRFIASLPHARMDLDSYQAAFHTEQADEAIALQASTCFATWTLGRKAMLTPDHPPRDWWWDEAKTPAPVTLLSPFYLVGANANNGNLLLIPASLDLPVNLVKAAGDNVAAKPSQLSGMASKLYLAVSPLEIARTRKARRIAKAISQQALAHFDLGSHMQQAIENKRIEALYDSSRSGPGKPKFTVRNDSPGSLEVLSYTRYHVLKEIDTLSDTQVDEFKVAHHLIGLAALFSKREQLQPVEMQFLPSHRLDEISS